MRFFILAPVLALLVGCALPSEVLSASPQSQTRAKATTSKTKPVKTTAAKANPSREPAARHPLMAPAEIARAQANFPQCIAGMWPQAQKRGVSRASFDAHTRGLTPDMGIMKLLDTQPEFSRPIWDYVNGMVAGSRIAGGRAILEQHREIFDAVERQTGVDKQVIAAIWGIETSYGKLVGGKPVLRSTATLACIGRRQEFFRDEFLATLDILHHGDLTAEQLRGSWAGAFGPTQFMPTTFKKFAVDYDGDGKADVVDSVADLIASTANNLALDGWQRDRPWGYEVVLPDGFDYALADRDKNLSIGEWERLGVRRMADRRFPRSGDSAFLLLPAGAQGPAFLMLENFRVIMKYNPAEAYALSVGHLADRLMGGGAFVGKWPTHERMLSRTERFELQRRLAAKGYDIGEPDGKLGNKTRIALRNWQAKAGMRADGFATVAVLQRLRGK